MFSLGNVKERILHKRMKHLEEQMQSMKKLVEEIQKENDLLKKESLALKQREEELKRGEEQLKLESEKLGKEEEELKKGEAELLEMVKTGGLLQEQVPAEELGKETAETARLLEAGEETGKERKAEKGRRAVGFWSIGKKPKTEVQKPPPPEERPAVRSMETPLDKLLELINSKGKIKIDQAAKVFKVKEGKIEEWAGILEEHNLIEVHYPAMGKPVLKPKSGKKSK